MPQTNFRRLWLRRFGLRELVFMMPLVVAIGLLNTRPRFPNIPADFDDGPSMITWGPMLGPDTEYGWPLTCVDVHYTIRPTLTLELDDFGVAHYRFRWFAVLMNVIVLAGAVGMILGVCRIGSRCGSRIADCGRQQYAGKLAIVKLEER
ncbi:hypothetical protein [Rhodopirellula sp. SWK7]|uniref:hypothetical protein n=1 Tax=Rhodopirellula sp. SWK7 TaxID=595460 RepID=UPI0002BE3CD8|nr:hypothetical protein [Rhodopirellula sp. SWK7]EMI40870.1 membrane protein [Rhodopirellula sp. SWK7]